MTCAKTTALSLALLVAAASAAHADHVRYPDRYFVGPMPREHHTHTHTVHVHPPEPPPPVWVPPTYVPPIIKKPALKDPFAASGPLFLGVGFGGLMMINKGHVWGGPSVLLQAGVSTGAADFNLKVGLPLSRFAPKEDSPAGDAQLISTRASFDYRFVKDSFFHPVVGAGLSWISLNSRRGSTGHAFAATARIGFEFAYRASLGTFAFGLDAEGQLPFARTDMPYADTALGLVSFGAFGTWRF